MVDYFYLIAGILFFLSGLFYEMWEKSVWVLPGVKTHRISFAMNPSPWHIYIYIYICAFIYIYILYIYKCLQVRQPVKVWHMSIDLRRVNSS